MSEFGDPEFDRQVNEMRQRRAEVAALEAEQTQKANQQRLADEARVQALLRRAPTVLRLAKSLATLALDNDVAPDILLYNDVAVSSRRERDRGAAPLKTVGDPIPAWRIGYRETDRIVDESRSVGSRGIATVLDHNGTLHTCLQPWDVARSKKGPSDTFGQGYYINLGSHGFIIEQTLASPPELVATLSLPQLESDLAGFALTANREF